MKFSQGVRWSGIRASMARRVVLVFACASCAVGGCNLIGVTAAKTMPPPREPAAFELGQRPTAVIVTADPAISGEYAALDAETVAIALERRLKRQTKAPVVEESAARLIVRVELYPPSAQTALGSDYHSGQASARVRVESVWGQELWPDDGSEGYLVEAQTPRVRGGTPAQVRRATLRALGEQAAALFYSRELRPNE